MDVFPVEHSANLVAVAHPGKWDPFEALVQQGRVKAFISFMEPVTHRVFHHPVPDWQANSLHLDNFKRTLVDCKKVNFFDPRVKWARVAKKLKSSPTFEKRNTDQRLSFKFDNMFLVKQMFTFGLSTVPRGVGHVYQTSDAPMIIYHMPHKSLKCRPTPFTSRRSFVEHDQYAYDKYVLRPNGTYVVPPGTRYLILSVQKTLFAVDVMAWEDVEGLQDFRTHINYAVHQYNLPPPTPAHEMQAPRMVRPEERRVKCNLNVEEKQQQQLDLNMVPQPQEEEVFMVPQPQEESVPVHHQPQEESVPVPQQPQQYAEMQDQIIFFEEPAPMDVENDNNWATFLESTIPKETVNNFLTQFEKELSATTSLGPAHQIHLDGPIWRLCPMTTPLVAQLPPPPDNYWGPNESGNDCEPLMGLSEDTTQDDGPWDLRTKEYLVIPRKNHTFSNKSGPMDLTVQTVM